MSDNKNESSNSNANQGNTQPAVKVELTKGQKQFDTDNDDKLSPTQMAEWQKAGGKSLDKILEAQEEAKTAKNEYTNSVKDNTKINTQIKQLDFHKKIVVQSFEVKKQYGEIKIESHTKNKLQLCDILNDYKWTLDTSTLLGHAAQSPETPKVYGIPHCYLIQYIQKYSSNITNFINTIVSAVNTVNDEQLGKSITDIGQTIDRLKGSLMKALSGDDSEGQGQGVQNASRFMYSKLQQGVNYLASKTVNKVSETINNGIMTSNYLAPYKLLYDLEHTNQRYVFPMVAQPPINKLINSYGQKQESDSILSSNSFLNWWDTVSSGVVSFGRDLKDFGLLLGKSGKVREQSNIEKAKFFNYPSDTEEYTITFPLLNTVKGNSHIPEWQKNYKFIMLFMLRNMVFRKDNASYHPPLFYDLIIPGVIRQPFCYIKQVNVKPVGLTRMLLVQNLFSFAPFGTLISVPVPQAWIVTIKVKSLLSTSANMILSEFIDLNISSGYNYENYYKLL